MANFMQGRLCNGENKQDQQRGCTVFLDVKGVEVRPQLRTLYSQQHGVKEDAAIQQQSNGGEDRVSDAWTDVERPGPIAGRRLKPFLDGLLLILGMNEANGG